MLSRRTWTASALAKRQSRWRAKQPPWLLLGWVARADKLDVPACIIGMQLCWPWENKARWRSIPAVDLHFA